MGFQLFTCSCLCWPPSSLRSQANHQPPHHHHLQANHPSPSSTINPDERTPLIVNPPEITPPPHLPPIIDTAQQQADEEAANKIVYQTVRCLVDVYSQAPFSHLRIQGSHQPLLQSSNSDPSHTPEGSTSTWRAYDPPRCPPAISEVLKLSLGFDKPISNFHSTDSHSSDGRDQQDHQTAGQKRSFHSLKTIINHQTDLSSTTQYQPDHPKTLPSLIDHPSDPTSSSIATQPALSTAQSETRHHSRENSTALTSCSTRFDTVRTFRTARDDPTLVLDDDPVLSRSINLSPSHSPLLVDGKMNGDNHHPNHPSPEFVHHLFTQDSLSSKSNLAPEDAPISSTTTETPSNLDQSSRQAEEGDNFLTDDPKRLSLLISQGFRLKDPGPILVEL